VLILAAVFVAACASTPTPTPQPPSVAPPTVVLKAAPTTERTDGMKIRLTLEDTVMTATLTDSKTTQDFLALLPLTVTLEDYAGTEKISYLPKKLSTEDAP